MIANGGVIGTKSKKMAFSITPEQLSRVQVSAKPVRVSQLVDMISAEVNEPKMKKMSTTTITDWLLEKGFLEKQIGPDGKSSRVPTQNGLMIGLATEIRQGQHGEYQAVFYNASAQRFVLDHLSAMLEQK